jgi:N-methylhydantoinase B
MLRDAHFMSIADRSVLACWGLNGGRAGRPFSVVIDPGGPNERAVDALADAEYVRAGEVIRIRTTGGGGWGDPLDRPYDEVARDVRWGKVSVAGAREDYGVVIDDPTATDRLRAERRAARDGRIARDGAEPFFDRGPGFPLLAGGRRYAEVDLR